MLGTRPALPDSIELQNPVEACWRVSHDPFAPVSLDGGGTATPLEIQGRYLEWLSKYVESELEGPVWTWVIDEWRSVLEDLEADPARCGDRLDWVAKKQLIEKYIDRDGLSWQDHKLRVIDLLYHDIDPARSPYERLLDRGLMRRLFTEEEITGAMMNPPESTRAYFRGRCVSLFPESLVAANWDSLVFDTGKRHLERIPMMEPLRGDITRVGTLLDSVDDAAGLIEALGGTNHG